MKRAPDLTQAERQELSAHIAEARVARVLQWVCAIAGIIGMKWEGVASLILGALGVYVFGMARPPPSERLDELTGRKRRH